MVYFIEIRNKRPHGCTAHSIRVDTVFIKKLEQNFHYGNHKTNRHHYVKTERRHSVTLQSPLSQLNGRYISVTIQSSFSAIQSPFHHLQLYSIFSYILYFLIYLIVDPPEYEGLSKSSQTDAIKSILIKLCLQLLQRV